MRPPWAPSASLRVESQSRIRSEDPKLPLPSPLPHANTAPSLHERGGPKKPPTRGGCPLPLLQDARLLSPTPTMSPISAPSRLLPWSPLGKPRDTPNTPTLCPIKKHPVHHFFPIITACELRKRGNGSRAGRSVTLTPVAGRGRGPSTGGWAEPGSGQEGGMMGG